MLTFQCGIQCGFFILKVCDHYSGLPLPNGGPKQDFQVGSHPLMEAVYQINHSICMYHSKIEPPPQTLSPMHIKPYAH